MKHKQLQHNTTVGVKQIPVGKQQAQTLAAFRRSVYGPAVEEILLDILAVTREEFETNPATEERRYRVHAVKDVLDTLFRGQLVLK